MWEIATKGADGMEVKDSGEKLSAAFFILIVLALVSSTVYFAVSNRGLKEEIEQYKSDVSLLQEVTYVGITYELYRFDLGYVADYEGYVRDFMPLSARLTTAFRRPLKGDVKSDIEMWEARPEAKSIMGYFINAFVWVEEGKFPSEVENISHTVVQVFTDTTGEFRDKLDGYIYGSKGLALSAREE